MFRETLLESAPLGRKRKRWPMAVAFTLELLVGAALVALPLLSTGIIPVSARPPIYVPHLDREVPIENHPPNGELGPSGGGPSTAHNVVSFNTGPIHDTIGRPPTGDDVDNQPPGYDPGPGHNGPGGCVLCTATAEKPSLHPLRISVINPGALVHRVEPIYPRTLVVIGVRGEVRLHAIIAKDGSIQSLTAISGHPLLVHAAIDAVKQWRYQPYYLNGEPVEVETFITVNFNRGY